MGLSTPRRARAATLALLAVLLGALTAPAAAAAPALVSTWRELDAFANVLHCAPLNILLYPNATNAYGATIEAAAGVAEALETNVTNGALSIGLVGPLATTAPIKLTVSMPADALVSLAHFGLGSNVYLASGFSVHSLALSTAFGASSVSAVGLQAPAVSLSLSGVGNTALSGTFGDMTASLTGTGALYVDELAGTLTLNSSGVNDVYITAAGDTASIVGTIKGIGTVKHAGGTCSVTGPFSFFASTCESVPASTVAPPDAPAYWTCGLNVTGAFRCSSEGLALQSNGGGATAVSSGVGTAPALGSAARNDSAFDLAGPLGSGAYQQSGSVGSGGSSTASSATQGTGSVSSTATAGNGQSTTSSTVNGVTVTNTAGPGAPKTAPVAETTPSSIFQTSNAANAIAVSNANANANANAVSRAVSTADAAGMPIPAPATSAAASAFASNAFSSLFGTPAFAPAPMPEPEPASGAPAPSASGPAAAAASPSASGAAASSSSAADSLGTLSVRTYAPGVSSGVAASLTCAVSKAADELPWQSVE